MILADSGFWIALASPGDRYHHRARDVAAEFADEELVTTWPVLTEAVHLIYTRYSMNAALHLLGDVAEGACTVANLPADATGALLGHMRRYRDLPMDLADASLVWLAEELGEGRIFSTDLRDFQTYRWKSRKPFKNLLLDDVR